MSTLEQRIRLEVARVITNASNFPEPMRVHMWGRDLSEPIDMIAAALLPVIREAQAEAFDDGVTETFHQTGETLSDEVLDAAKYANFYRSNDDHR